MPENENNPSPNKKKRGCLWTIIIILIILLAAVIGGYALFYYNALPAWITDMLPDPGFSTPQPVYTQPAAITATDEEEPEPSPSPSVSPAPSEAPAETDGGKDEDTVKTSAAAQETVGDDSTAAPAVTSVPYIGADAAADGALQHSKVSEKDADFSSVMLTEQNGIMLYEVVFTAGDYRYEYYIDSLSGRVESWKKTDLSLDTQDAVAASAMDKDEAGAAAGSSASSGTDKTSGATVLLGEDEAKELAMAHANISEKDIKSISCKIELQGLNLIYEVDMSTTLMKYEYEIDAITGDIVGFEVEPIKGSV